MSSAYTHVERPMHRRKNWKPAIESRRTDHLRSPVVASKAISWHRSPHYSACRNVSRPLRRSEQCSQASTLPRRNEQRTKKDVRSAPRLRRHRRTPSATRTSRASTRKVDPKDKVASIARRRVRFLTARRSFATAHVPAWVQWRSCWGHAAGIIGFSTKSGLSPLPGSCCRSICFVVPLWAILRQSRIRRRSRGPQTRTGPGAATFSVTRGVLEHPPPLGVVALGERGYGVTHCRDLAHHPRRCGRRRAAAEKPYSPITQPDFIRKHGGPKYPALPPSFLETSCLLIPDARVEVAGLPVPGLLHAQLLS